MKDEKSPYFFVIGAQKSGTTTLHSLLKENSEICFSEINKEVPFFSEKDFLSEGWDKFIDYFFSNYQSRKIGSVSPQYMYSDEIASMIYSMFPNVKIIALLRDPIDRAISHYNMNVSRGLETRKFSRVIKEELDADKIKKSRKIVPQRFELDKEVSCYFVWGEYGRILKSYYNVFPSQNILILFTKTLNNNPKEIIYKVSEFLSVSPVIPNTLNEKYHVTLRSDFDIAFNVLEKKLKYFKKIAFIPESFKSNYRKFKKSLRKPTKEALISKSDFEILRQFYLNDLNILKNELGFQNIAWEHRLKYE